MAAIAADHGLTIAMEPHERTLVDSVRGVRRMLAKADGRLRVNFQLDDMVRNSSRRRRSRRVGGCWPKSAGDEGDPSGRSSSDKQNSSGILQPAALQLCYEYGE